MPVSIIVAKLGCGRNR